MKSTTKKSILLVVAHPDDEVLGCGGTVAKHVAEGDEVNLLVLADGETSRPTAHLSERNTALKNSCQILGIKNFKIENFPDNKMDSVALLEIVKKIEAVIEIYRPGLIYTHFAHDLNVDHRITNQAVLTACRPVPGQCVKEIRSFEVVSSTQWNSSVQAFAFQPNIFVDISTTFAIKQKALSHYEHEMRPWPHQRSHKALEVLAQFRGATVGFDLAEAFYLERKLD